MKKMLLCLLLATLLYSVSALAAPTTLTGYVTDTMCGKDHMMEGKSAAQCIKSCVKGGAKLALYSGGKVYVLAGKADEVTALAGKNVKVTGELKGETLSVSSIAEAQ